MTQNTVSLFSTFSFCMGTVTYNSIFHPFFLFCNFHSVLFFSWQIQYHILCPRSLYLVPFLTIKLRLIVLTVQVFFSKVSFSFFFSVSTYFNKIVYIWYFLIVGRLCLWSIFNHLYWILIQVTLFIRFQNLSTHPLSLPVLFYGLEWQFFRFISD